MSIIPVMGEVEIERIVIPGQPGGKVSEPCLNKQTNKKKPCSYHPSYRGSRGRRMVV
jgi:hypothetical protein